MKKDIDFQEFQAVSKSVLKRLAVFCEQNSLRYYLSFGTLLGAVRHNDTIPWDYDIDILMPRSDLNKFLELTKNQDAMENITVFSWVTHKKYYLPFVKVCDSRTRLVITKTTNPLPLGIWVDIFPLDGISDDPQENDALQKQCLSLVGKATHPYIVPTNYKERLAKIPPIISSVFTPSSSYLSTLAEVASKYDFDKSKRVAVVASLEMQVEKGAIKKEWLDTPVMLPFGDREYSCPSAYDEYLRMLYGDYMQLPPEEKRKIPDIHSYWIS